MTEIKCFRDAFRDQLHELSGQPNSTGVIELSCQDLFRDSK